MEHVTDHAKGCTKIVPPKGGSGTAPPNGKFPMTPDLIHGRRAFALEAMKVMLVDQGLAVDPQLLAQKSVAIADAMIEWLSPGVQIYPLPDGA